MLASIQIGNVIEKCTITSYKRSEDYPQPMVWVKPHARNRAVLRALILPATLLTGKPLHHNAVTYTYLG